MYPEVPRSQNLQSNPAEKHKSTARPPAMGSQPVSTKRGCDFMFTTQKHVISLDTTPNSAMPKSCPCRKRVLYGPFQIVSVVNNVSSLKFGSQTQLAASSSPFTGQADGSRTWGQTAVFCYPPASLPALEKGLSDLRDTSTPFSVSAPPGGHAGMQTQDCPRGILLHPLFLLHAEPPPTPGS